MVRSTPAVFLCYTLQRSTCSTRCVAVGSAGISAVNPEAYKRRFQSRLREIIPLPDRRQLARSASVPRTRASVRSPKDHAVLLDEPLALSRPSPIGPCEPQGDALSWSDLPDGRISDTSTESALASGDQEPAEGPGRCP
jgi:hypothetical protein